MINSTERMTTRATEAAEDTGRRDAGRRTTPAQLGIKRGEADPAGPTIVSEAVLRRGDALSRGDVRSREHARHLGAVRRGDPRREDEMSDATTTTRGAVQHVPPAGRTTEENAGTRGNRKPARTRARTATAKATTDADAAHHGSNLPFLNRLFESTRRDLVTEVSLWMISRNPTSTRVMM